MSWVTKYIRHWFNHLLRLPPFSRLIIVPDGEINALSFDCLPTTPQPTNDTYMVFHHAISYSYSASLAYFLRENYAGAAKGVCITSPFKEFLQRDSLHQQLSSLDTKTESLKDIDKKQFTTRFSLKHAPVNWICLYVHSEADIENKDSSYLKFGVAKEDRFYYPELFSCYFQTNLFILARCKSGHGKQATGEGIMSLARGRVLLRCKKCDKYILGSRFGDGLPAIDRILHAFNKR